MQKIKSEIIIDGDTVIVNGETYDKRQIGKVEQSKEVHPFLKDVPTEHKDAYTLTSGQVSSMGQVFQREIDRGTVSLNREYLEELDRRRVALTALKKWIGENNVPVASEEQLADVAVWKFSFRFNYALGRVIHGAWQSACSIGDIHFLADDDFEKVRKNCDALIRTAYGWPVIGESK